MNAVVSVKVPGKRHRRGADRRWLVLVLLLGITLIVGAGRWHYLADSRKYQQKAEEELAAIADAKATQILSWRQERLSDGNFFSQASFVMRDLQTLLADPTTEPARTDALKWIKLLKGGDRYEQITVIRPDLTELLSVPTDPEKRTTPPPTEATRAFQSRKPILTDLHRDADGRPHIDVLVPVLAAGDPDPAPLHRTGQPIAALVMRLDPEQFLFPLIQSWPTPSPTAETVLIRQEGNEGVYLNQLRHRPANGSQRFSLDDPTLPAAIALRGHRGVIEGTDYRGVPVLTAFRAIPDSSWLIGVKMDKAEIAAPVHAQAIYTVIAVLGLVFAMIGGVGWFWRQRETDLLRRELDAERSLQANEKKYHRYIEASPLGIFITDAQGRFVETNPAARRLGGYNPEELSHLSFHDFLAPEHLTRAMRRFVQARETGHTEGEIRFRRKDGTAGELVFNSVKLSDDRYLTFCREITFEKQVEATLIENQQRLQGLVESAMDAIITIDDQQRITLFNPAAEQLFGYRATEILGHPLSKLIPERFQNIHGGHVHHFGATGETRRRMGTMGDISCRKANGDEFPAEVSISKAMIGGRQFYTSILRDVTERLKTEASLKLFRTLIDRANDAIEVIDAQTGCFLDVNERGCTDVGYTRSEFLALRVWDIDPRLDETIWQERVVQIRSEKTTIFETIHQRKDGSRFPVEVNVCHVQLDREYLVAAVRDITERKRTEEEVRRLSVVVEQSPTSIVITDQTGAIQYVNRKFTEVTGYSAEEAIGQNPRILKSGKQGPEYYRHMWDELSNGRVWRGELLNRRRNGEFYWEWATISPIVDERGNITHYAAIKEDITRRKQAESALREREEQMRLFIEYAPAAIAMLDTEMRYLVASHRWLTDYGLEGVNLIGRNHYEVFPEIPERWKEIHRRCLAGSIERAEMDRFDRADGSTQWLRWETRPRYSTPGTIGGLLLFTEDITARLQNAMALRESEDRFRQLVTLAPVPISVSSHDGTVLLVNDRFTEVFGYTTEDIPTIDAWWLLAYPDPTYRQQVVEIWTAATLLATGKKEPLKPREYRVTCKDGRVRTVEISGIAIESSFLSTFVDLTEREQAEAAIRQSEERLRLLTENASDLITVLDAAGKIIFESRSVERILGYSVEELLQRQIYEYIHPEDAAQVGEALQLALAKPSTPVSVELRFRHKDGTWRVLQSIGNSIPDEAPEGFIVVNSRDLTESRKLETQFRQSQKMEAIGQLAGGVAHDFNNLLSVITGYSELASMKLEEGDPIRASLSEILQASQRAASLTRQLLVFSRQQVLEPKVLDLNASVTDAEKMLRRLIGEDVELATALSPGLHSVKADPGQITQVIMNLAVNARDAMPQGGRLTIETRNVEFDEKYAETHPDFLPGEYVLMAISDTGSGMPPEVRARIFEPFFTTKGVGRGTGLGLSVVHGIVKQSGGHLEVYSEVDIGTVFKIYLPAVQEPVARISKNEPLKGARGGETILLVEDEDPVRRLTAMALEHLGYKVIKAAHGPEALKLAGASAGKIDLLVTDVVMPMMSGRQVAEALLARFPTLKVLYQSGYTDDAVVRHGILRSEVAFLQKPFTLAALATKVREVLDQN